ncbi:MAG: mercury(II) reductase [Candidatus Parvarchaeota archaeon]|jgi:mercuric reductase|nr:mercury(II) reductase [Candidatus Parvarchaeota archaeon]MCL5107171.1 mercury(II) reductase [Candidatus Parvarchaeota archaeon]
MEEYEYAIIGHGAAAFAAALKADELGIKTVMIGKNETKGTLLGGTCVNVGCVPSKRLITIGNFLDKINTKRFDGLSYSTRIENFGKIIEDKEFLVGSMRFSKYQKVLGKLKNVKYVNGFASFKDKNTLTVDGREIKAKKILIATGARAKIPGIMGIDKVNYLTNEEALSMKKLPKSIIIVGGRALGLEFAEMFAHFGVNVTLLQRSDRILPNWEPEVSYYLEQYLKEEGVNIITGVKIDKVSGSKEAVKVYFSVKGSKQEVRAQEILLATGRTPNIEKLNLNGIGVKLDKNGFIKINKYMETSVRGIYAAGDVTGEPMLEALAAAEGNKATANAFSDKKLSIDINSVPSAVFTFPEAARVGLTDKEANSNGIKCACQPVMFKDLAKAGIIKDTRGLIKMVINANTKRILGVEIVGENAADLIHEAVLAVKFKLTIDDIIDTVHMFPTLSEIMKLGALSFYHNVEDLSCCSE